MLLGLSGEVVQCSNVSLPSLTCSSFTTTTTITSCAYNLIHQYYMIYVIIKNINVHKLSVKYNMVYLRDRKLQ